ncbi:MAG: alpha/beta hydrolase [Candidatus Obscuribacterales bacterium]|nr:alpha/beta hydrolase [Candidatus Obscuribacterales bacterium]
MKVFSKNLFPIRTGLLTLSIVFQCIPAVADTTQTSVQASVPDPDEVPQGSRPARRLRLRQMLEQRAQGDGQLKQGNSPKIQDAFAAIDPGKVKVQRDVPYGHETRQDLDIYTPVANKTTVPVLLFVHGGGWQIGNKTNGHIDKGVAWAENGVAFVSINYRLAPEVTHPKQIEDVALAFAWVQKHASEFGGDPKRIFVMGHSAGAQLVDLLATNGKYLQEQGLKLADIKGVISLDTASLNLNERLAEDTGEARLVGGMIKSAFGTDPAVLTDASPTLAIRPGISYPPFLMFCGEKRVSCCAQHQSFSSALKKVDGTVTVQTVPLSHGDISKAAGQPDSEIFKKSLAFIQGKI